MGPHFIGKLLLLSYESFKLILCRKYTVYEMLWRQIDLSDYVISAARYGGPLG